MAVEHLGRAIAYYVGAYGQAIGSLATAAAVIVAALEFRRADRRDAEAEKDELETRQLEIYQRLELESMRVFEYEAQYRSVIHWYKTDVAADGPPPFDMNLREANLCARKYYEMCCNLFEVAIRLRGKNCDYIENDVFGSWVAWFFDTTREWGFRAIWAELRDNYTHSLRADVFDPYVFELITAWDQPQAVAPRAELTMPNDIVEPIRTRFYADIGTKFACTDAAQWLEVSRSAPPPLHPRAFM